MQGQFVTPQVNTVLFFKLIGQVIDDHQVKIFAAQECIAICGLHLKHAVANFENRNIKRAATQIIDRDSLAIGLFVQAISQSCRRRLIYDAQDLKASDLTGVLGSLTL